MAIQCLAGEVIRTMGSGIVPIGHNSCSGYLMWQELFQPHRLILSGPSFLAVTVQAMNGNYTTRNVMSVISRVSLGLFSLTQLNIPPAPPAVSDPMLRSYLSIFVLDGGIDNV